MRVHLPSVVLISLFFGGCQDGASDRQTKVTAAEQKAATTMHTVELGSWGNGAPALQIDLPVEYGAKKQEGPDFTVFYVEPAGAGDSGWKGVMGIYIGHHPDFAEMTPESVEESGAVGRKDVKWRCRGGQEEGRQVRRCETLVRGFYEGAGVDGGGVKELVLHLFISGEDATQVQALKDAAKTLRLKQ